MARLEAIRIRRKKTPLVKPGSIKQLQKAMRKGHVTAREPTRLEKLRYRKTT